MFSRVLFPVDFSSINENILRSLDELKIIGVEEVVLAHIVEEQVGGLLLDEDKKKVIREALVEKAESKLEEYRRMLEEKGFKATVYKPIPVGKVEEEILRIEDKTAPNLLLLSSKGRNWFKPSLTGSTSETLLRKSRIPVLYIKILPSEKGEEYSMKFRGLFNKIMVATDLSRKADKLYECAVEIARRTSSRIRLLHVIEYYRAPETLVRLVREELERDASKLEEKGVRVSYSIRRGVPHKEIIDYALEHDVSLIIMGMRGEESFLRGLIMGSTADAIVRHSPVPLLVCK